MTAPKYEVTCPVCGAEPNKPCRTLKTNRVTDTHLARIEADFEAFAARHDKPSGRANQGVPMDDDMLP